MFPSHFRQLLVINTALQEERVRPAFTGVNLDCPLQFRAISHLAQQRQSRAEQEYPGSARRFFAADMAQAQPKAVELHIYQFSLMLNDQSTTSSCPPRSFNILPIGEFS